MARKYVKRASRKSSYKVKKHVKKSMKKSTKKKKSKTKKKRNKKKRRGGSSSHVQPYESEPKLLGEEDVDKEELPPQHDAALDDTANTALDDAANVANAALKKASDYFGALFNT